MKIQKTTQPAEFQPIVLEITIENEEELHNLLVLSSLSADIHAALYDQNYLEGDVAATLEDLLDDIAECL